ncbi:MAG: DUF2723 domain-containing protein [Endomicrobiales bacterium]|nr:DUF2723 domain-containing protein [Endomicrobiales bacterium]
MRNPVLLGAFFAAFTVYVFTMHPSVSPYRDSGDLSASSVTLGIAHPPGYPLYVLMGKVFSGAVNLANKAYRMNLMSAFWGACAVCLLAAVIIEFLGGPLWGVFSLTLAFSPAMWRLSQVSEMYSLNAFFAVLLMLIALRIHRAERPAGLFCLFAFTAAFAAANHQTIIFLIPGMLLFVGKAKLSKKDMLAAAVFAGIGLSVYLYLAVRAARGPEIEWGEADSLKGLFKIMTRSDYGGMRLHPEQSKFAWSPAAVIAHCYVYIKSLVEQFSLPGALLGLAGMFFLRKDRFAWYLLISLFVSGPLFVVFSNLPPHAKTTLPILEPHLILPGVMFAVFIAAGAKGLATNELMKLLVFAVAPLSFFMHYHQCANRANFCAHDYGRNLLSSMPQDSIVYDPDDPTAFILKYLQTGEGRRGDVKLAAFFRTRWGYELMKKRRPEMLPAREINSGRVLAMVLLDHNRKRFPIFAELPSKFPPGYVSYPTGLVHRLSSEGEYEPDDGLFRFYSARTEIAKRPSHDFFTNQVVSYYSAAYNNTGLAFYNTGAFSKAYECYLKALAVDPELDAAHNNLGSLEYSRKNYALAEKWFRRALASGGTNPSGLYNLGLALEAQGKTDEAAANFNDAWYKHGYPDAGNELGLMYMRSGRLAESKAIFENLVKTRPDYLLAYYNLGVLFRRSGDFQKSREYFEKYVAESKDENDIRDAMEQIRSLPR